jgi:hypothetical protein
MATSSKTWVMAVLVALIGMTGSGQQKNNSDLEKMRAIAIKFRQAAVDVVRDEIAEAKNTSEMLIAAREMLSLADCNQDAFARLDKYLAQHQAIKEKFYKDLQKSVLGSEIEK